MVKSSEISQDQKDQPDAALIAEWEALEQEVFEGVYSLPGADVAAYQPAIQTYGQRSRELRPLVDRYLAK